MPPPPPPPPPPPARRDGGSSGQRSRPPGPAKRPRSAISESGSDSDSDSDEVVPSLCARAEPKSCSGTERTVGETGQPGCLSRSGTRRATELRGGVVNNGTGVPAIDMVGPKGEPAGTSCSDFRHGRDRHHRPAGGGEDNDDDELEICHPVGVAKKPGPSAKSGPTAPTVLPNPPREVHANQTASGLGTTPASASGSARRSPPLIFYPAYCYRDSPTFRTWAKLRIVDIFRLQTPDRARASLAPVSRPPGGPSPAENAEARPEPPPPRPPVAPFLQDVYFFLNHPVRFVQVVCPVVAVTDSIPGLVLVAVDDGSGAAIEARIRNPPQAVWGDCAYGRYVRRFCLVAKPGGRVGVRDGMAGDGDGDAGADPKEPHPLLAPPTYPSSRGDALKPRRPGPPAPPTGGDGLSNLLVVRVPPPITSLMTHFAGLATPASGATPATGAETSADGTAKHNPDPGPHVGTTAATKTPSAAPTPTSPLSALPIQSVLLDGHPLEPATVVKVQATITHFRAVRQLEVVKVRRIPHVASTMAEVAWWRACRLFRADVLEKGWRIDGRRERMLRDRALGVRSGAGAGTGERS